MISYLLRLHGAWKHDHGPRMAAALAFYTFLALTPLLVLAVLVAGILFGDAAARSDILARTQEAIGPLGAEIVQGILERASRFRDGLTAMILGLAVLLYGASRAFHELQAGLGRILTGPEESRIGRKGFLRRLISVGLVLAVCLGLVLLMIGGMALDATGRYLGLRPGLVLARVLDYLATFGLGTLFLSLLFRFVPDRRPGWTDAAIGAGLAAGLFVLGRFLVSLYLERTATATPYGAAGLVVVVLVWLYFSARIVYIGAEVTSLRADPSRGAVTRR